MKKRDGEYFIFLKNVVYLLLLMLISSISFSLQDISTLKNSNAKIENKITLVDDLNISGRASFLKNLNHSKKLNGLYINFANTMTSAAGCFCNFMINIQYFPQIVPFSLFMKHICNLSTPPPIKERQLVLNPIIPLKPVKTDLSSIKVQEIITPEHFKIWFVPNTNVSVVTIAFTFKEAGYKSDPKGKRGLVRLLASMMDEGAGTYDAKSFKKFILENNIRLKVDIDADILTLQVTAATAFKEKAFEAIKLILTKLRLDKDQLERVKDRLILNVRQEFLTETTTATQKLECMIYKDHPYNMCLKKVIQEIPSISKNDLSSFIEKHLCKDNIIISACGDIDSDDLSRLVDDSLKKLPEKSNQAKIPFCEFPQESSNAFIKMDIPQTIIVFAHKGFSRSDKNFYPLYIALEILRSGDLSSRLMETIRVEKGLVYGIQIITHFLKNANTLTGFAQTSYKNATTVIELIKSEINRLAKYGITDNELDQAKKHIIGEKPIQLGSTDSITKNLIIMQVFNLGIDFLSKRTGLIENITKKEVNDAIQGLFNPDKILFVAVGKKNPFE